MKINKRIAKITALGMLNVATLFSVSAQTQNSEEKNDSTVEQTNPKHAAEQRAIQASKGLDTLGVVVYLGKNDKKMKKLGSLENVAAEYEKAFARDFSVNAKVLPTLTNDRKTTAQFYVDGEKVYHQSLKMNFSNIDEAKQIYIGEQVKELHDQNVDILEEAREMKGYVLITHIGGRDEGRYSGGVEYMQTLLENNIAVLDGVKIKNLTDAASAYDPNVSTNYTLMKDGEVVFQNLRGHKFERGITKAFAEDTQLANDETPSIELGN